MISIEELAKITPVSPPTVNRNTNPRVHNIDGE
jgi:DNA-binding MurR/RpiR family transcriptional regulator